MAEIIGNRTEYCIRHDRFDKANNCVEEYFSPTTGYYMHVETKGCVTTVKFSTDGKYWCSAIEYATAPRPIVKIENLALIGYPDIKNSLQDIREHNQTAVAGNKTLNKTLKFCLKTLNRHLMRGDKPNRVVLTQSLEDKIA